MPTPPEIRPLAGDDVEASYALQAEAFGVAAPAEPPTQPWPPAGRHARGAWSGSELVATGHVTDTASWFGGRAVPTAAVGGVAVGAEHRGGGLLGPLMGALHDDARARGRVVAALFPSAPGIYRRLGYEVAGEYAEVEVAAHTLARIPAPQGVALRRAGPADAVAQREVYARWAAAQNGPLVRDAADRAPDGRGTLVLDGDGAPVGCAVWSHTGGARSGPSTVVVHDLVTLAGTAAAALWRLFGSFATVAGTVRVRTSGADTARLVLPAAAWRPVRQWPYALRLLDVVGAVEARGVAPLDVALPFGVVGDGLDGTYRLTAAGGTATCARATGEGPVFSGRGLALLYAGVQSCANLRFAGLLGGPAGDDARWDALFGGRPFHIRDYF